MHPKTKPDPQHHDRAKAICRVCIDQRRTSVLDGNPRLPWEASDIVFWQDGFVYCPIQPHGVQLFRLDEPKSHCPYHLERLMSIQVPPC